MPIVALFALGGCGQIVRKGGFSDVKTLVGERGTSEASIEWRDSSTDDQSAADAIQDLLSHELTPDTAVQIALLNNPGLQATFEELGIAQANAVQAGLPKNPAVSAALLFGSVSPAYDFDVLQNFLDLLLLPARKRIAATQYEQVRLRVAGEVIDLAARVRSTYYTLQGGEQLVSVLKEVLSASEASAEFAEELHRAGNINDLQLATERSLVADVQAEVLRAEAATISPTQDLRELLGIATSDSSWKALPPTLPGLPSRSPALSTALLLAKEKRLDLAAARSQQAVLAQTLETARAWRYFGSLDAGANTHREQGDRNWVAGPSVALGLPIFDQRQAEIARLESELRQSARRTEALTQVVAADVSRAFNKLAANRQLAEHYRLVLIPARAQVVAQSEQLHNFMLLGAFDLLQAKRLEITAYGDYIGALRDYWIEAAELEKAVGARVELRPSDDQGIAPMPATSAMPMDHMHHGNTTASTTSDSATNTSNSGASQTMHHHGGM